jgi:SAM-dependent methyltransferase
MAAHEDRHWWFVARRRILDRLIARRIEPKSDCRVLEAGCGTGGNLSMRSFEHAAAFEPDAAARALATAKSMVEVRDGALPDRVPFPRNSFDLVAMLDVLEHVDDDLGSLRAVAERLAPGGRLVLTVPAYRFLWSRHDEFHHHKRRYRKDALLAVATAAGLQPSTSATSTRSCFRWWRRSDSPVACSAILARLTTRCRRPALTGCWAPCSRWSGICSAASRCPSACRWSWSPDGLTPCARQSMSSCALRPGPAPPPVSRM